MIRIERMKGDLVIPASKCNSKIINFMAKHGRGLICLALPKSKVKKLGLPFMSSINKARMQTAFTISIEAKKGISTGISAFDDRVKQLKLRLTNKLQKRYCITWSRFSFGGKTRWSVRESWSYRSIDRYI